MFSLIPWKKSPSKALKVRPEREEEFFPLARMRDEFDALWSRFLGDWGRGLSPRDDGSRFGLHGGLEDKENEYVLCAELPGLEPGDIEVKVSGNTLTVCAEHKEAKQDQEGAGYRYGSFHQHFTLPYGVDDQKIDARYRNGVLEVHLPKTEQAKGKRIPVQTH
jgi:HSP20 family protein